MPIIKFCPCDRSIAKDIDHKQAAELEERDRELAMRVADATLEQIKSKLEIDMKVLEEAVPTASKEAKEAQLDLKYLKDRQKIL